MTKHPTVDTALTGYRAVIQYRPTDCGALVLPGWHDSYGAALARAKRVAEAMIDVGESGCRGVVGYSGVRPVGMQRNQLVA